MRPTLVFVTAAMIAGCSVGMGPNTAASRPVLGWVTSSDKATMWSVAKDQTGVPPGFVRVDLVEDGFAKIFNFFSIVSAVRKGNVAATGDGVVAGDRDVVDLDLAFLARFPLPVGAFCVGVGHAWALQGATDLTGWGVRASVAPIGQLSLDFAHSWGDGSDQLADGSSRAIDGTHTSLGGTVLLFGYRYFRWGVSVARTWTRADPYASDGYTYSLVGTMY
ncbi:MAG: hypothetical protein IPL61_21555 [Myxococcales bacterium]|nr:hypothetical protein [Myxococcales bacterium]